MTIHINLLDWRKERRERRKKEFIATLGLAVAIAGGIVAAGWMLVDGELQYQQARNEFLRVQIKEMDKKIKEIEELEKVRANLLARMRVIEQLQASRTASVHFFDELVNTLPDGVSLTGFKQQGNKVTIDGIAESNGRVSTYMKNLDASPWFSDPRLIVIKTGEKDRLRKGEFQLVVNRLTKPQERKAQDTATEGQSEDGVIE
ncbi:PilN domain-containing protein [Fontimonas sp. SYSU GA230001]|uniref:PilN domain-containing protein n=1 Tax=Fontimonas sp. SYSU GA230001 TaxID=3142450 RepID=UPI0032B313C3